MKWGIKMQIKYEKEKHFSAEFPNYSSASRFAQQVDGTIDGPFYDYDNTRYYVVNYESKKFNFFHKK